MASLLAGLRDRQLNKLMPLVERIESLRPQTQALSDAALRNRTWAFRSRLSKQETLDDLLPEAFAVVREAARRVLGMEPFPVQLLGGIALHQGRIAQMCTGEGKTLVATLPAYLNALSGQGVHVVTCNDYLAQRDRDQMGKVHEFLGLTVGAVVGGMDLRQRKEAYDCDITYVTNSELGFDYLRDNMAKSRDKLVQRGFHYAIIDEVDSVLIDEARTPLIISGQSLQQTKLFDACSSLAKRMVCGGEAEEVSKLDLISGAESTEKGDFLIIEKEKRVILTQKGIRRTERFFRIDNIADPVNAHLQHHMDVALRAWHMMQRDREYVVQDGQVLIVDEMTGRIAPGRQFSNGLHQAIQAKERVAIQRETRTIATITYQSFFNKYPKKGGMTGTGKTAAREFSDIYGLEILVIPTNRPILRKDQPDVVFRTRQEKLEAVFRDVQECRSSGRPVLVGTTAVSESEALSRLFTLQNIPHQVLNARYHRQEAAIVALAGQRGAVTIATNMAGRGTDIKLDDASRAAGGLLVIGTERAISRRIDGQLQGRAGRQGDPGESWFYLSLEDDLLRLFGQKKLDDAFAAKKIPYGTGVTDPMLSRAIEQAQARVEGDHYAQRKRLLDYDRILDHQREIIYEQRRRVLKEQDPDEHIHRLLENVAEDAWQTALADQPHRPVEGMLAQVSDLLTPASQAACCRYPAEEAARQLAEEFCLRYDYICHAFSDQKMLQERARMVLLETVDACWTDHLEDMEQLRQGIGLVTYAQKDPLEEYQRAAFLLFEQLNRRIRYETAAALLRTGDVNKRG